MIVMKNKYLLQVNNLRPISQHPYFPTFVIKGILNKRFTHNNFLR